MSLKKLFILIVLSVITLNSWAVKEDTLYLINGDRIIGEIKQLNRGLLTYKTDDIGTISAKWKEIAILISKSTFEVELFDGRLFYGSFARPSQQGKLSIVSGPIVNEFDLISIVGITEIENRFWSRLDGHVDLGLDYTKATEIFKLNFDSEVKHRRKRVFNTLKLSNSETHQPDKEKSIRSELSLATKRILKSKNYYGANLTFQRNTELGIELRTLFGGSFGRKLIQSNQALLLTSVGLAYNREQSLNDSITQENLEGTISIDFERFRYDSPKVDITTSLYIFPSVTNFGRVRSEFDLKFKWELIKDFFLAVTFYTSYDNQPPTKDSRDLDYGIVTSIGYTF